MVIITDPEDVRAVLPPGTDAEDAYLATLIARAWRRLDVLVSPAPRYGEPLYDFAQDMVVDAVKRVVIDPAPGLTSESEAGYSYSKASALDTSANIWFPAADLALLTGRPRGRVGTIKVRRPRRDW